MKTEITLDEKSLAKFPEYLQTHIERNEGNVKTFVSSGQPS